MHDAEGYTLREIEAMTDIAVGTLKSRLSRARARLRDLLRPEPTRPRPSSQRTKKIGTLFLLPACWWAMERTTMNCTEVENQLDDYLDHSCGSRHSSDLDDLEAAAIAMHIQGCADCQVALERRHALLHDLRSLPVPAPAASFLEKTIAAAAETVDQHSSNEQNRRRTDSRAASGKSVPRAVIGLAAALLGAVMLGTIAFGPTVDPAPDSGLPSISLTTDTVTPIKLAFSSEKALDDARLHLSLPVGVELMGYDGRSDISWNTDLEAGTNVLRLPLVGRTASSDLLVARLEHPTGTKTFRLHVTVNDSGARDDD